MHIRRSAALLLGLCLATPVLAFDSTTARRGAQLEETVRARRAADPALHASDRELAQAILSQ